jgi:sigma-B regulation protein RsbU (phosphoserine phosphatase)
MKKSLLIFFMLAPALCAPAHAQDFDLNAGRQPVASLDGLWRFNTGDDPQWSNPNFDDSKWPLLRSDESWAVQGYRGYSGSAWYRFRVTVPASTDDLSIYLPEISTNYEVYADGLRVGGIGKMPPDPTPYSNYSSRIYALQIAGGSARQIEIAIRVWHWPGWAEYEGGGPAYGGATIGDSADIHRMYADYRAARCWSFSSTIILSLLQALAAIAVFLLFLLRRSEREYLWFSLFLAFSAAQGWAILSEGLQVSPILLINGLMYTLGFPCAGLAQLAFYRQLLKARRSPLYLASLVCLFAALAFGLYSLSISFTAADVSPFRFFLVFSLSLLPGYVWILSLLFSRARHNFVDARLLLAPVLLQFSAVLFQWSAIISFVLGWQSRFLFNILLFDHPFPIQLVQVGNLLFLLGVLAILILRFTRTRSQEERFAAEVQSARNIQQYLIPEHLPDTPGLAIESVYRPSREVGGDFFQVLPSATDSSALIVVGDVAGKGMQAGMLATLIVGVIRTAASFTNDPGQILSLLNERMHGRALATCLALRIEKDGNAVLANAGHLPPYLNGKELPMEGALPLGAVPGFDFPLLRFKLSPGDSLMLMTDGVAEAQNAAGHLFGFDRIAELLRGGIAASALATAAQDFGQEDDITVLTVARMAQAG